MEYLIQGIGRGILGFFKWLSIAALVDSLIYGLGYIVIKIVTFGKYPTSIKGNKTHCLVAGLIAFIVIIGLIAVYNGR